MRATYRGSVNRAEVNQEVKKRFRHMRQSSVLEDAPQHICQPTERHHAEAPGTTAGAVRIPLPTKERSLNTWCLTSKEEEVPSRIESSPGDQEVSEEHQPAPEEGSFLTFGEGGVPDIRQRLHEVAGHGPTSPSGGCRGFPCPAVFGCQLVCHPCQAGDPVPT